MRLQINEITCSQSTLRSVAVLAFATLTCLCFHGCAHRTYSPTKLPPEYVAPVVTDVASADLSRLSNISVNSQLIDCGDVIEVTIFTGYGSNPTITMPARVSENGFVDVPLVGQVHLAGLELQSAEGAITSAAVTRGVFRHPHITVTMKNRRTNKVTVIGGVKQPGVYELPRNSSSLLCALVAAGGISEEANQNVEIRRSNLAKKFPGVLQKNQDRVANSENIKQVGFEQASETGPRIINVNLVKATQQGSNANRLHDGDVVTVGKRVPKPIHIIGLVRKPGAYELPHSQNLHLLDAIAMAGGRSNPVADKIIVRRAVDGKSEPITIKVSIAKAKADGIANVRLAPGDLISIENTPATVVLDTLQNFLRIGMSASLPLF